MFLSISNVAVSDRVFASGNLLFADQQSQGTSLGSLRLSIIVCINPPQHNCPINFSSEELPWPALLYSLSASRKLLHHHRSSILSPSASKTRPYSIVRAFPSKPAPLLPCTSRADRPSSADRLLSPQPSPTQTAAGPTPVPLLIDCLD